MADADDVRRLALALPHVEEIDSDGFDFRVGGKGFVWSYPERTPGRPRLIRTDIAVLYVGDEAEKQALLLGEPRIFFTTPGYDGWPLVMVRLAEVDVERLAELVTDAWRMRAPAALADEFDRCDESARVEIENPVKGTAMTEPKTCTLDAPGAVLHYDVRGSDASTEPVLLLIGSPMGAAGFVTLAGHFTDRTVVTYDPRGAGRSKRTDGAARSTTEEHADDLHRLILALDAGPVDIFASSGGAVNALALVARHPEQVRTLVAHEPPAAQELPDREPALAACEGIHETYQSSGYGPAMAKFIALVSYEGPIPAGFAGQPGPNPADFGLPTEDDGSRDDALVGLNMPSTPGYQHDFDALRAAPTRIVVGVGAQSAQQLAGRAGTAVAERLGTAPVTFPGGHDGFLGGEYGGMGEPDAFAATLRKVLDG